MDILAHIKPADNEANITNPNKGTDGTNRQYDQAQGNRGKQLDPNQRKFFDYPGAAVEEEDIDGDVYGPVGD